jgi:tagatose-1,6-bisphosphate aldolase
VYYHPDAPTAAEIEAFVRQVADECATEDLVLMLEPLSYSLDPAVKTLPSAERRYVVVETARRLPPLGADVLKAEFPLDVHTDPDERQWEAACAEISAASPAPWILLSGAADFETYLRMATAACRQGASGVAVGRAVWQEAPGMSIPERLRFLEQVARPRLARLTALCLALARPWTDFYPTPVVPEDWYVRYGN